MANKPDNFEWMGFTREQLGLLNLFDQLGNNGWARTSQTEALMPCLLADWADEGLPLAQLLEAMRTIRYDAEDLHQLERWERKRVTGKFGR